MTAVKERGETAFEEAGKGILLRFTNRDLKELQAKYGKTFLNTLTDELLNNVIDVEMLCEFYAIGTKKPEGDRLYDGPEDPELDKLQIGLHAEKLLDALYTSIHGCDLKGFFKRAEEAMKEQEENQSPPPH